MLGKEHGKILLSEHLLIYLNSLVLETFGLRGGGRNKVISVQYIQKKDSKSIKIKVSICYKYFTEKFI